MYETLAKIAAGIPTTIVRGLLFPSILVGALVLYQTNARVAELEKSQVRVSEQRESEIAAIKELASEVRQYREALVATARQQEQFWENERRKDRK